MVAVKKSETRIKTMREEDLPVVLGNERASYDFPWSEGIFRDCLRAGYSCLVITADDDIVGHGVFQFAAGEAHILNICVAPAFRQLGYARALLHGLFAAMRNMAVNTVYLEVRPSNIAAVNLYLSEGFNEVGVRKDYYRAPRRAGKGSQIFSGKEDALIMARYCDWDD